MLVWQKERLRIFCKMPKTKIYIAIASDHGGFKLKKIIKRFLIKEGYKVEDLGPFQYDKDDDYPDFALKVCKKVLKTKGKGILICGSGQGMDRTANKVSGIYAEVCWSEDTARHAKEHSHANVLCFGEKTVTSELAKKMVKIWLETPFTSEKRHIRRINKISKIEKTYFKK